MSQQTHESAIGISYVVAACMGALVSAVRSENVQSFTVHHRAFRTMNAQANSQIVLCLISLKLKLFSRVQALQALQ